jgi:hypothetical protein
MSKRLRCLAWFLCCVAWVSLCGAGCRSKSKTERTPSSDSAADAGVLSRRLCEALHALPAERKAHCCGGKPQQALLEECVTALSRSLAVRALELDPNAVSACVADMRETLTGCDCVTPGQPLTPEACQNLFRGRLAIGAACRSSLECAGALHCEGSTPTHAGRCAAPAPIGAGCGTHIDALASYVLVRGLERTHPFCSDFCSLTSHKCEPIPSEGSPCAASVNCGPEQGCVQGACTSRRGSGADAPCAGASCAPGLRCLEGRCRPFARAGEQCATDFECAHGGCVANLSGDKVCGAKCSLSLAALQAETGQAMRLPLRQKN